jgi:long-subunit acyl-CoA synthetase (AMP-forming)
MDGQLRQTYRPGRRLLPAVIDERAQDTPEMVWASLPLDDRDLSRGYTDVTYASFANAINKLAHFIVSAIGRSNTFETGAYLGAPDVRYHMMQMAVCKTGHKVLFTSHFNSLEIHRYLLSETKCTAIFSAKDVSVDDMLSEGSTDIPHHVIPDLDPLLDLGELAEVMPYTKTFEEGQYDP